MCTNMLCVNAPVHQFAFVDVCIVSHNLAWGENKEGPGSRCSVAGNCFTAGALARPGPWQLPWPVQKSSLRMVPSDGGPQLRAPP